MAPLRSFSFIPAALRKVVGDPSPGTIVVTTRHLVTVRHHRTLEVATMGAGENIFVDYSQANVGLALTLHLFGNVHDSELRFGLAILLGLGETIDRGLPLSRSQTDTVDAWIDANVVFEVLAVTTENQPRGKLNGMRGVWLENGGVWPN